MLDGTLLVILWPYLPAFALYFVLGILVPRRPGLPSAVRVEAGEVGRR